MRSVFLVGFMGCGKSTVCRSLAGRLELPFVDLDEEIERAEGATVSELFEQRGERGFRAAETRALELQTKQAPAVVATGGGLYMVEANRCKIRRAGQCAVFLDVPWSAIEARIGQDNESRPLWRDRTKAQRLYEQRLPTYRLADVVVTLRGNEPPADVAEVVWREVLSCAT